MRFHPWSPLGHDGRHFSQPDPPKIVTPPPAPTVDDPAAKAAADAAAASAKKIAQRRGGYAANILTPPKIGARAISLLGGGEMTGR